MAFDLGPASGISKSHSNTALVILLVGPKFNQRLRYKDSSIQSAPLKYTKSKMMTSKVLHRVKPSLLFLYLCIYLVMMMPVRLGRSTRFKIKTRVEQSTRGGLIRRHRVHTAGRWVFLRNHRPQLTHNFKGRSTSRQKV